MKEKLTLGVNQPGVAHIAWRKRCRLRASGRRLVASLFAASLAGLWIAPAHAQERVTPGWKDAQIGPKPDWSWLPQLRVVTEADFPPFNYYDEEGQLAGFNVDLARAVCRELTIPCEINASDWDSISPSLQNNEADAAFASIAITAKTLETLDFTGRYYSTPARFVGRAGSPLSPSQTGLTARTVGVVQDTAHEAFLKDFFPGALPRVFSTSGDARAALRNGQVDLLFGDGISLMFWIQGSDSNRCCEFKGGAYTEPSYFGDGVGIAVKRGNDRLRGVLDYALARVRASGRFEELTLRYFPLPIY